MKNPFASSLLMLALMAMPSFGAKKPKDASNPPQAAESLAAPASPAKPGAKEKAFKGGPTQNASPAQITDAKAKGMVWVNTVTGVYHNNGQYFGATKEGKFMSEADARKAGYQSAKHPVKAANATKVSGK